MIRDALKDKKLGGANVKEEAFAKDKVLYYHFEPTLEYAWDNGVGIGIYLSGLKEGKLIASHCRKCKRTMLPARAFCELCYRPTDEWVQVRDTGTVETFSVARIHFDASRLKPGEKPTLPAVISIDGADAKMGILHLLDEVEPEDIYIGMKVQAVWRPAEEREGDIRDIMYFRPVKAAAKAAKKAPAKAPAKKAKKAKK
ncbi:MAG: Zn-ribbon domain-containing OB-fold protein [Myxococcales bacterium]|nr:MAG: Zn-ribbon domain-containing OB-fold protein [Myxococcales bacterium]